MYQSKQTRAYTHTHSHTHAHTHTLILLRLKSINTYTSFKPQGLNNLQGGTEDVHHDVCLNFTLNNGERKHFSNLNFDVLVSIVL